MALVVMKFGGSSIADIDKIRHVAEKVIAKKKDGNKLVVVVSAPGNTTDDLLKTVGTITSSAPAREIDVLLSTGEITSISLLAIVIYAMGEKAISMTGPQAGIYADSNYTCAKIKKIDPKKIKCKLEENNIVIVAGFQALNPKGDITTLGRGGSDLTAVALAAVLKADSCEIYSDVEGVYVVDPRVVKTTRKNDFISYDEMLEIASSGAQILQSRSIEVAKKFGVEIHAKGTFSNVQGTVITSEEKIRRQKMERFLISGITFDKDQVKFSMINLPDIPGITAKIFGGLAKIGVNMDMIIQFGSVDKKNNISITVSKQEIKKTKTELDKITAEFKDVKIVCDEHVAKVSIIGVGMKSNTDVASQMFEILYKEGINIEMISTSEIKISCIIDELDVIKAIEKLHKGFGLLKNK